MNAVLDLRDVDPKNVHFAQAVPNTVLERSDFIRIVYSDHVVVLSALLVAFEIRGVRPERYFSKQRCLFNPLDNAGVIEDIGSLERSIITRAVGNSRTPSLRVRDQLAGGSLKLFTGDWLDNGGLFVLKISGVWDDGNEAGITFRFSQPHRQFLSSVSAEEKERDVHHHQDEHAERVEEIHHG